MRIVFYAHDFVPSVGGVPALVLALAQGLAGRRLESGSAEVTVITQRAADGFDDRTLAFRVVRRPGLGQLVRLLRGADILHLAGPCLLPMLLGLLLRKPVAVEHHGFQAVCPNGLLHYEPTQMPCPGHFMARRYGECLRCNSRSGNFVSLKMWLLTFSRRWLCHQVAENIAITRWLEALLQLPRTTTVHLGVAGANGCAMGRMLRPPLTFVFIGRLVSSKGGQILLRAAHRLKAKGLVFSMKMIGDGPERSSLEAQATALQLNDCVKFLGYLPQEEIGAVLGEAAAVVMPSLSGETFGLVAAENMVRGRLLIVSALGALAEVVGDAGLTFPVGDVDALASCLERVLKSPALAHELGQRARERALHFFREDQMIEGHVAVYRKLLGNGGHSC